MSASPTLDQRLDAVVAALDLARGHLDPDVLAGADHTVERVRARMGHGTDHTVIALAGATGVGKSSLFNAIVGHDVSSVGVRRPTTGVAHAAVWGEGGDALLDWLRVGRRHHVVDDGELGGLILVDLPDFDSVEASNRAEVDRMIDVVDALVWVTDPQKYADEAFHDGYLRPLAGHADVMHFVVNKIDTVATSEHPALLADLERRLHDDGISAPRIVTTSVGTGAGLHGLAATVAATLDERRVVVDRLSADLRHAATELRSGGEASGVSKPARRDLVQRLGHAAGVHEVGAVVVAQHRKDARMAMGWPPVRLLERFRRRHPISTLPRATASTVARSEIDLALRDVAESVSAGLDRPWPTVLRTAATDRADDVTVAVTSLTRSTAHEAVRRPRWWTPVSWLQRLFALVALAGAMWLIVVAVLGGFLQLDTDPLLIDTPGWEWIPVPSLLVLGGLGLGLMIALVVRIPVGLSAHRRGASVRSTLLDELDSLARATVIADLDAVVADRRAMDRQLALAAAP